MAKPNPLETVRRIMSGEKPDIDPNTYGLKTFKDADDSIEEADMAMGVVNAKSDEDKDLYQDGEGKGAKIDTDELEGGKEAEVPAKGSAKKKKTADANKATVAGKAKGDKGKVTVPATEHLEAIFDGEDLTEDFMDKVATIFEVAINERVETKEAELQEEYESTLAEHLESVTSQLTEKIDDYLGYVVEEWVKENQLVLENGLRTEITENFIQGLKTLFQENHVDLPEEKADLFTEVNEKNEQIESALNEQINTNIELKKSILEYRCNEILENSCRDLVDTDAERFHTLAEGIEFENEEQYQDKISVLKESYFGDSEGEIAALDYEDDENLSEQKEPLTEGVMKNYVDALSRTIK
jgi:hypothetical protein